MTAIPAPPGVLPQPATPPPFHVPTEDEAFAAMSQLDLLNHYDGLAPSPNPDIARTADQLRATAWEVDPPTIAGLRQQQDTLRATLDSYITNRRARGLADFPTHTAKHTAARDDYFDSLYTKGLDKLADTLKPEEVAAIDAAAADSDDPDEIRARTVNTALIASLAGRELEPDEYLRARDHYARQIGLQGEVTDRALYAHIAQTKAADAAALDSFRPIADQAYQAALIGAPLEAGATDKALAAIPARLRPALADQYHQARQEARNLRRRIMPLVENIRSAVENIRDDATNDAFGQTREQALRALIVPMAEQLPNDRAQRAAALAILGHELAKLPPDQRQGINHIANSLERGMAMTMEGMKQAGYAAENFVRDGALDPLIMLRTKVAELKGILFDPESGALRLGDAGYSFPVRSLTLAAQSVPYTFLALAPGGTPYMMLSLAGQSEQDARIRYPEGDDGKRLAAAATSGVIQGAVETMFTRFGYKVVGNKLPTLTAILNRTGVQSRLGRAALGGTAGLGVAGVTEYTEEALQDYTDTSLQDLAAEFSGLNPDTDWNRFLTDWIAPWTTEPNSEQRQTLMAILPFMLLAGGGAAVGHVKNANAYLKDTTLLRAAGLTPEETRAVLSAPTPEAAQQTLQAGLAAAHARPLTPEQEAQQAELRAAALEKLKARAKELDAAGLPVITTERNDFTEEDQFIFTDPQTGAQQTFQTEEAALEAFREWAANLETTAHATIEEAARPAFISHLLDEGQAAEDAGVRVEDTGQANTLGMEEDAAKAELEDAEKRQRTGTTARARAEAEQQAAQARGAVANLHARFKIFLMDHGLNPAAAFDAFRNIPIRAKSVAEKVGGRIVGWTVRLYEGATIQDIAEDVSESVLKDSIEKGLANGDQLVEDLRAYEEGTGTTILEPGYQYDPANALPLIEAFSKLARGYLFAEARGHTLPAEVKAWVDFVTAYSAAVVDLAKSQAAEIMGDVAVAADLRRAMEGGHLPERLRARLADSVGMNEAERELRLRKQAEAQLAAEAMEGFPEIAESLKGRLPHPLTAREKGLPLAGELRRIWEQLLRPSRRRTKTGKEVDRTNEANAFFLPKGQTEDIDAVRRNMNELGFDFQNPADMLDALEASIGYGKKHYGTRAPDFGQESWAIGQPSNEHLDTDGRISGVPASEPSGANIDEATGLPLNPDGTVTLFHGTTKEAAAEIVRSKLLKSTAERRVYLTTDPTAGAMDGTTGYGDGTVVVVHVKPETLALDDEFQGGRKDFAIDAPKKSVRVVDAFMPFDRVAPLDSGASFAIGRATVTPGGDTRLFQGADGSPTVIGPASFSLAPDYGIPHRPNEEGPRAFALDENNLMPADVYEHPEWYSAMGRKIIAETMKQLRAVKGKADALLTIYRAGPTPEMNTGDWVSLSKEYARTHADAQDPDNFKVWAAEVKAADVRWAMDDLAEFGYFGAPVPATESDVSFAISAYHGTPHKVDKFSLDKIGTGEGAQAYGWGLYFAMARAVGDEYMKKLARPFLQVDGQPFQRTNPRHIAGQALYMAGNDVLQAKKEIADRIKEFSGNPIYSKEQQQNDEETLKILAKEKPFAEKVSGGNLYRVELLVEDEDLLDWDKPLSEQSEKVKAAILAQMPAKSWDVMESKTGQAYYQSYWQGGYASTGDIEGASRSIAKLGIRGIRYLDGNSRHVTHSNPGIHIHPIQGGRFEATVIENGRITDRVLETFDTHAQSMKWLENQHGTVGPSYNYVIFDDADIRITEENGKPVNLDSGISFAVAPLSRPLFSSAAVSELRSQKARWKEAGHPYEQAREIVAGHYRTAAYAAIPRVAVLVPMPSTNGRNTLPLALAERISKDFGQIIETRPAAVALAREEAKNKRTFLAKEADPVTFLPVHEVIAALSDGPPVVVTEDVHNTGESWIAFVKMLQDNGVRVAGIATLASTEQRLTTPRDIERMAEKVAALTDSEISTVQHAIHSLFHGTFKQLANKAEADITGNRRNAAKLLAIATSGQRAGAYANPLPHSTAGQPGSQNGDPDGRGQRQISQGEFSFALSLPGLATLDNALLRMANRGPEERAEFYERLRNRLAATVLMVRESKRNLAVDQTDAERERNRIRDALMEAQAIIAALPPEARARVRMPVSDILSADTERGQLGALMRFIAQADDALEDALIAEYREGIESLLDLAKPDLRANQQMRGRLTPETQRIVGRIMEAATMTETEHRTAVVTTEKAIEELQNQQPATPEAQAENDAQIAELSTTLDILTTFGPFAKLSAAELAVALTALKYTYTKGRYARRVLDEDKAREMRDARREIVASLPPADQPAHAKGKARRAHVENFILGLSSFHQVLERLLPKSLTARDFQDRTRAADRATTWDRIRLRERYDEWTFRAWNLAGRGRTLRRNKIVFALSQLRQDWGVTIREGIGMETVKLTEEQAAAILAGELKPGWETDMIAMQALGDAVADFRMQRLKAQTEARQFRRTVIEFKRVVKRGKDTTLALSDLNAAYLLQLWAQPQYRPALDKWGFTEAAMAQIEAKLDHRANDLLDFMRAEYDAEYDRLNPVYRAIYHMDMPRIRNYAPGLFAHMDAKAGSDSTITPDGGTVGVNAMSAGFTKTRQHHLARPDDQANALNNFFAHMEQTSYFVHFGELVRDMRQTFRHPDIRYAMEAAHGEDTTRLFYDWLDAIEVDGRLRAKEVGAIRRLVGRFITVRTMTGLAYNIGVLFKQLSAANGVFMEMPTKDALNGILRFLRNPAATWSTVWNSEAIQQRVLEGINPEDRRVLHAAADSPSASVALLAEGRVPIAYTDAMFTSLSASVVYSHHFGKAKKAGLSDTQADAAALAAATRVIERTAQPATTQDRSFFELHPSLFVKWLMLFKSDPRKQFAIVSIAALELRAGRITLPEFTRKVFWGWMVYGLLNAAMTDAWLAMARDDDDPDKWTWQDYLASMVAGPLSAVPIIGQGLVNALAWAASQAGGKQRPFTDAATPLEEGVERLPQTARKVAATIEKALNDTPDDLRINEALTAATQFTTAVANVTGSPRIALPAALLRLLRDLEGVTANTIDLLTHTPDDDALYIARKHAETVATDTKERTRERDKLAADLRAMSPDNRAAAVAKLPPKERAAMRSRLRRAEMTPAETALDRLPPAARAAAVAEITAPMTDGQRAAYLDRLRYLGLADE